MDRADVSEGGSFLWELTRQREMKQQMKTGVTGSNSQVAADSTISWVCGLTGLV